LFIGEDECCDILTTYHTYNAWISNAQRWWMGSMFLQSLVSIDNKLLECGTNIDPSRFLMKQKCCLSLRYRWLLLLLLINNLNNNYYNNKICKDEVIINRLRIGHSKMFHGHLMRREEPLICLTCVDPLTVKNLLFYCRNHIDTR